MKGEHVGQGKKSCAIRFIYQTDHTLKEDEINEAHDKILSNLKSKVNAELRS